MPLVFIFRFDFLLQFKNNGIDPFFKTKGEGLAINIIIYSYSLLSYTLKI